MKSDGEQLQQLKEKKVTKMNNLDSDGDDRTDVKKEAKFL
jgi:flagellar biosynthesis/type III secretory pathway chaperone